MITLSKEELAEVSSSLKSLPKSVSDPSAQLEKDMTRSSVSITDVKGVTRSIKTKDDLNNVNNKLKAYLTQAVDIEYTKALMKSSLSETGTPCNPDFESGKKQYHAQELADGSYDITVTNTVGFFKPMTSGSKELKPAMMADTKVKLLFNYNPETDEVVAKQMQLPDVNKYKPSLLDRIAVNLKSLFIEPIAKLIYGDKNKNPEPDDAPSVIAPTSASSIDHASAISYTTDPEPTIGPESGAESSVGSDVSLDAKAETNEEETNEEKKASKKSPRQ